MTYITLQDLLDELGENLLVQLADDGEGEVDETRVNKVINKAQGVFDSYVRTRYSIPVPATAMVKGLNADLAIFELYKLASELPEGRYEVKKQAKDDAIKLLTAISQGKAALDVPAVEETTENPATSDRILSNAAKSKFSDTTLQGF